MIKKGKTCAVFVEPIQGEGGINPGKLSCACLVVVGPGPASSFMRACAYPASAPSCRFVLLRFLPTWFAPLPCSLGCSQPGVY